MSDFTPTVFLSPPPRIIPHTPPSLPATRSPSPQPVHRLPLLDPTRDVSQKCTPDGQQRASSTDPDPNSEQGRVTMQTRVAVRDATPHRFQIIPLREHKLSNITDTRRGHSNEPRYRSHEPMRPANQQLSISEPLSSASHEDIDGTDKSLSASSTYSLCVPQTSASKQEPIVVSFPDIQSSTVVQVEKRAATSKALPDQIQVENALHAPSLHEPRNSLSISATHPTSSEYPDVQKSYQRNVKSNIVVQDTFNGSYIDSASGRIKCRACSEDLTHCRDQKCAHGHFCLCCPCGDSSWHTTVTVTRRHAIYTDALVLPIIGLGSSTRQMRRAPVAHNLKAYKPSRNHRVGPRHSQESQVASNQTPDKGLRVATGMVFNSQPGNIVTRTKVSCQANPPAEHLALPVPRLRLFKKTRHLSASETNPTHDDFAKHSNTILDLFAQLDQAISDWKELGRDHAVLYATVPGSRL